MIIIGEKINASNKSVGQAIANKDSEYLSNLARQQADAGADFIDVNAGTGLGSWDSAESAMTWLLELVQEATDKPVAIDSDEPGIIEASMGKYNGETVMINSVNANADKLERIGRLAAGRGALLVALVMGEGGIPSTVEERLEAADFIMQNLSRVGVEESHVYFDPLVLPIAVDKTQGLVTLKTIEGIKSRYPSARTVMGLSNISYGLPQRGIINRAFLVMAAAAGLDAAILDPLDPRIMGLAKVADMLTGNDTGCKAYIRAHRKGLLKD